MRLIFWDKLNKQIVEMANWLVFGKDYRVPILLRISDNYVLDKNTTLEVS